MGQHVRGAADWRPLHTVSNLLPVAERVGPHGLRSATCSTAAQDGLAMSPVADIGETPVPSVGSTRRSNRIATLGVRSGPTTAAGHGDSGRAEGVARVAAVPAAPAAAAPRGVPSGGPALVSARVTSGVAGAPPPGATALPRSPPGAPTPAVPGRGAAAPLGAATAAATVVLVVAPGRTPSTKALRSVAGDTTAAVGRGGGGPGEMTATVGSPA